MALQHGIAVHQHKPRELLGAMLFARTISSSQGAVILLEYGLVSQARCVLRSSLEAIFALSAISERPALVDRLVEAGVAERRHIAKNISLWNHPELKIIAEAQRASGKLTEVLAEEATSISVFELAQAAGYEDWYRTIYMTLSWSVHSAVFDLERHVVKGDDGEVLAMRNEPETKGQEVAWLVAVYVEIEAARALAGIFESVNAEPFEVYESRLHELAKSIEG